MREKKRKQRGNGTKRRKRGEERKRKDLGEYFLARYVVGDMYKILPPFGN